MRLALAPLLFLTLQTPSPNNALPPIDPNWIYTTPIHWQRIGGAPGSESERCSSATTAVLYPDGKYVEISSNLLRFGKGPAMIPGNDGLLIRTGTWARTDEDRIRIHAREVMEDKMVRVVHCETTPQGRKCPPLSDPPLPGPFETVTCALEGRSPTHLAKLIHCPKFSYAPPFIDFDLKSVRDRAAEGFAATPDH
jgi:hypothetical protein